MRRPLSGVLRGGVLAGAVGTTAMDFLWFNRYRAGGGTEPFPTWEFKSEINGFDDAPAPARVAQAVARKVNVELPEASASTANNVVHWSTGISWGVAAMLMHRIVRIGSIK